MVAGKGGETAQHRHTPLLQDWRKKFDLPDLSFLFVQLAPYVPRRDFTAVRNAQMAALQLPKTGYAVAIDLGDPHSPCTPIHPRRKQEVGRRLALSARAVQYGEHLVHTGPTFAAVTTDAATGVATIAYTPGTSAGLHSHGTADCNQVANRLCCRESPFMVQVGGGAGMWVRANYTVGEETVQLALPANYSTPVAVRYNWEPWPQCSMYNGVGGPDDHLGIAATPFCWNGTARCPW